MSSDRPLYGRLLHAFGVKDVHYVLDRLVNSHNPLQYLTPEAQQQVFEELRTRMKITKRVNAKNRAIWAEQKEKV